VKRLRLMPTTEQLTSATKTGAPSTLQPSSSDIQYVTLSLHPTASTTKTGSA
jgi:hypothetical protein